MYTYITRTNDVDGVLLDTQLVLDSIPCAYLAIVKDNKLETIKYDPWLDKEKLAAEIMLASLSEVLEV